MLVSPRGCIAWANAPGCVLITGMFWLRGLYTILDAGGSLVKPVYAKVRSMADTAHIAKLLQHGIAAAKIGRKETVRRMLMRVVELDERNEQAWLWLSGIVDSPEDRRICMENVLAINPHNAAAQAGLRWLAGCFSLAAWTVLLIAGVGAYLWVSATDVPNNPGMRELFGAAGAERTTQRILVGLPGILLWLLAFGLILAKV
jgi:hypothetical protein